MEFHLGSDHRGFGLKRQIITYLESKGYKCTDHGCKDENRVDYPDYAKKVGEAVVGSNGTACGIVICGSGTGISIAVNKIKGIRCTVSWCEHVAEYGRRHNHTNVLAFSGDLQTATQVERCLDAFLNAEEEGSRHKDRVQMISDMEAR